MSAQDWAAIVTIASILTAGLTFLVKKGIEYIKHLVKDYLAELKPNGGGSMRDAVNVNTKRLERVENDVLHVNNRVDDIYKMLCEVLKRPSA